MSDAAGKGETVDRVVSLGKDPDGNLVVFMASGGTWKLNDTATGWVTALPPIPGTHQFMLLQQGVRSIQQGAVPADQVGQKVDEQKQRLEEIKEMSKEIISSQEEQPAPKDGKGLVLATLAFFKGREIDLLPWIRSNWQQVKKTPQLAREIHAALQGAIEAAPIL